MKLINFQNKKFFYLFNDKIDKNVRRFIIFITILMSSKWFILFCFILFCFALYPVVIIINDYDQFDGNFDVKFNDNFDGQLTTEQII